MKVALYGGSFNPPHVAHLMVALLALETQDVDEVWFVPTAHHAFGKQLAGFEHRMEMCRRLIAPLGGRARVDDVESTLPGRESRTIVTLEALSRSHRAVSFRLLIGSDVLAEKDSWLRWNDVVTMAPPILVSRAGAANTGYEHAALPEVPAVSSTSVRARLARGQSAVPLVTRAVMDYIADNRLYR